MTVRYEAIEKHITGSDATLIIDAGVSHQILRKLRHSEKFDLR